MKKAIIIILAIVFISCQSNSLKEQFNCEIDVEFSELKEYRDFLKNFRIQVPKNWKTTLYYDEYSSEIYSADTTKQLTDTYVLEMSWKQGELEINDDFAKKINDTLQLKEQLKMTKSGFGKFKKKPMYFNLSEGTRSGINYKYLQVYLKTNIDEYITLTSKVFGDKLVDERLCESVELFESLQLIE
ncbi:hypothetical protein UMM65_14100 [Aureibaculum sp. 2210JD6-5]|uniref:hypothetical protein n=1 Tax=Aureibaculum sp. 2210JD6-5 TaxID=3103957 RepID=UPI002AAD01CF|nr:hypothetical protein [Aureibaculum sp. 2210JD6-5]MDY7396379.1 hypothetical protein [Aureibaculum sp. 2210JD6-5]